MLRITEHIQDTRLPNDFETAHTEKTRYTPHPHSQGGARRRSDLAPYRIESFHACVGCLAWFIKVTKYLGAVRNRIARHCGNFDL